MYITLLGGFEGLLTFYTKGNIFKKALFVSIPVFFKLRGASNIIVCFVVGRLNFRLLLVKGFGKIFF